MIPDTVGAVLAFLGLIAPGLLFELLRERRRPAVGESAFREAGRVALTSFLFTLCGLGAVALLRIVSPDVMPDPGGWLRDGNAYVRGHFRQVVTALAVVVAVACGVAIVADQVLGRLGSGRAQITQGSVWYYVFDSDRPKDARVWLHLRLTDGSKVSGYMRHYTPDATVEDREISLGGPFLRHGEPGSDEARIDDKWDVVTVRADKIQFIRAVYVTPDGRFVRRTGKALPDGPPS